MSNPGGQFSQATWVSTLPQPEEEEEEIRPSKRTRVALACQRCKTRKQKCDGCNPCSKCRILDLVCEYIIPDKPMPFGTNQYIKSLERRVAELETVLARHGLAEPGHDHWGSVNGTGPLSTHSSISPGGASGESIPPPHHPPPSGWQHPRHVRPEVYTPESDHEADEPCLDWEDGREPITDVLRSLSLDANGTGYMGASSRVSLARLFGIIGRKNRGRRRSTSIKGAVNSSHARPRQSEIADPHENAEPIELREVPDAAADRLLVGYKKHISTRWPVLHSVWVREVHARRNSLTDVYETMMLHLVYAAGGRFLEIAGEHGTFEPQRHYVAAMRHLDVVLGHADIRSVCALMLMAVYCLRSPVGAGAWTYCRLAMLIAIDLGLHRHTRSITRLSMKSEMRKRVFWACYNLDRQMSIPLGRSFGIVDRDIDVPLPLDIDEATTVGDMVKIPVSSVSRTAPECSTSLSSFVHLTKLRRIESDIQQTIYRVDTAVNAGEAIVDAFLNRLEAWKAMIPCDTHGRKDVDGEPYDGYDYYMVFYFKCKRLLLYPQIAKPHVNPRYLAECATACAGVCGAYKRLHQSLAVGYSIMALQTVFMAGLTLVYCVWIAPDEIFNMTTSNGIHDCSVILFVIAERVKAAKKYRNAFDVIRQRVIDKIADEGPRKPREAVNGLAAELGPSMNAFDVDQPFEINGESFEQISRVVTEMAGSVGSEAKDEVRVHLTPPPFDSAGDSSGHTPASISMRSAGASAESPLYPTELPELCINVCTDVMRFADSAKPDP